MGLLFVFSQAKYDFQQHQGIRMPDLHYSNGTTEKSPKALPSDSLLM